LSKSIVVMFDSGALLIDPSANDISKKPLSYFVTVHEYLLPVLNVTTSSAWSE